MNNKVSQINKEDIVARECRFATFCPPVGNRRDDLHVVKEILHVKQGDKVVQVPNVRMVKNYKRPFWVTKKGFRNHKDKKEWELKDRVQHYESTQSNLVDSIARALGEPWFKGDLRRLNRSPYTYGTDILSTAVIKKEYQDKWPDVTTRYTAAPFDTETDVNRGTDEIIMGTISHGDKVFTAIRAWFVEGQADVHDRLQKMLKKYMSEFDFGKNVRRRDLDWEIMIVERESDIAIECFKRAHEWKPDFVSIWNITFDMDKMLKAFEKDGVDPAIVFSDPKVVEAGFHYFKFKKGPNQKVTASGKTTPIKPSAQWHTAYCPASFYFMDAMCAYRHIRTGSQEEPSYALDAILKKHGLGGKLKFEPAEKYSGLEWHQFMQAKHPLEYVVYNVFDSIMMQILDETTLDLCVTLPLYSAHSDFENFKSQPRRLADKLHYFCLENGKVFGSTSDEMQTELDEFTVGLDGWIVTLPAHLVDDNGLQVIMENPWQMTNIRGHVGDLDVSASYPNGGAVFNISKETTHKEMVRILGVPEIVQRMQGINLSAGHVNATEFCTDMYGMPKFETMLEAFEQHNGDKVYEPVI